jgi:DICT domain-containing protein/signal transduction histidine kinase
MSILTSVLYDLLQALPYLRPQLYFKASLTALSHAMEDQVLASSLGQPLVIASFQCERFYRQEAHRYKRLAQRSDQVYVLAAPETDFKNSSNEYETIAFEPEDLLSQEWHLIVISQNYATCLICREHLGSLSKQVELEASPDLDMDTARRFEGIWTSDRSVSLKAAELLLARISVYRPELAKKIGIARDRYHIGKSTPEVSVPTPDSKGGFYSIDPDPFVQRLVTYLQSSQYKLHKAYRSIAAQERKERLINSITAAIRRSLNSEEILKVAVQELGTALSVCRCFIYRSAATDTTATIEHEFLRPGIVSLTKQTWPLQNNPLFQEVVAQGEGIYIADTQTDQRVMSHLALRAIVEQYDIRSWLIMPVLYQGRLLGMVELHYNAPTSHQWQSELSLVEAIATQIGTTLIQAEAYANLEKLNQQLEALELTRSNLIAITGHELRTPLSTIQVCLESLASEPDMPVELQQVMLSTALTDSERMRKLVQDFLTLSNLESGRVQWHPEALPLEECVELALTRFRSSLATEKFPQLTTEVSRDLPLVKADGDWLVEVIAKLVDNACKFTPPEGQVKIKAVSNGNQRLEVTVADTGRGIEPARLQIVFDRFYQEEGALRRTTGGTGLGLAICRQIVNGWGGEIWAESKGKDQGSQVHFTIPVFENQLAKTSN